MKMCRGGAEEVVQIWCISGSESRHKNVLMCRGAERKMCRGEDVQRCKVQRCRYGDAPDMEVLRCKYCEVQRCLKGAPES